MKANVTNQVIVIEWYVSGVSESSQKLRQWVCTYVSTFRMTSLIGCYKGTQRICGVSFGMYRGRRNTCDGF